MRSQRSMTCSVFFTQFTTEIMNLIEVSVDLLLILWSLFLHDHKIVIINIFFRKITSVELSEKIFQIFDSVSHLCSIFNVVRDEDLMIKVDDLYGRLMVIIKSFSWQFKRLIKRFGDDSTSDARDKNIFPSTSKVQTFSDVFFWLSHNLLSSQLSAYFICLFEGENTKTQSEETKSGLNVLFQLFIFHRRSSSSLSMRDEIHIFSFQNEYK